MRTRLCWYEQSNRVPSASIDSGGVGRRALTKTGIIKDSADDVLPRAGSPYGRSLMQTSMRAAEPSAAIHLGVYGCVSRKEFDSPRRYCKMSSWPGAIYVSVISFSNIGCLRSMESRSMESYR